MKKKEIQKPLDERDILHVTPTENTKEWLETVNQIAGLNFRCPHCGVPLSIAVCEILFADKKESL